MCCVSINVFLRWAQWVYLDKYVYHTLTALCCFTILVASVWKKCFNSQQDGYGPQSLGPAYRPVGTSESEHVDFRQQFLQQSNQKNMEEAEDVDVNAGIHGALVFNGHGPIHKQE